MQLCLQSSCVSKKNHKIIHKNLRKHQENQIKNQKQDILEMKAEREISHL